MNDNPLQLPAINVAIVGSGAIGSALAQNLIERPAVEQVFLLCRNPDSIEAPAGVTPLLLDATRPETTESAAKAVSAQCGRLHLLFNTVGVLHDDQGLQPEKRLSRVSADNLLRSFQVNSLLLPALAQAFSRLLKHEQPALLCSLSARVGSIEDNRSGGWYSYRASKAAHNMLLRTLAREWRISHPHAIVAALHPGTVASRLSAPFVTRSYPHRVLQPAESAAALLQVAGSLTPADSGCFRDWRGDPIPW